MKKGLTTHFEADVPDEFTGALNRFLTDIRATYTIQANGTKRKKGEMPSRMNDGTRKDAIFAAIAKEHKPISLIEIKKHVAAAGYNPSGLDSILKDLMSAKLIKKIDRGIYATTAKQLPPPNKKGGSHG